MSSDYETAARMRKARLLADALYERGTSAREAAQYAPVEREALARQEGIRIPSDETWAAVVSELQYRETDLPPATAADFARLA